MALNATPQASEGIMGAVRGAFGLFGNTNKDYGIEEQMNPLPIDEYESSLSDEKIIKLTSEWKKLYFPYYDPIQKSQKLSFDYWVGKHRTDNNDQIQKDFGNDVDNKLFEAIETFLPIATRANPEPVVASDPGDIGQEMAKAVQVALTHEADTQQLRRKLAKLTRHWLLNRLGVVKVTWNPVTKAICTELINAKQFIFDKDGYIDERGLFRGEYLGEKKKMTAERIIELFPKKKSFIELKAQNKLGTKMEFIEWWYCGTDVFYTMGDEVLGKYKNPNWNYDGKITENDPDTGAPIESEIQGINHFKEPTIPYVFMSVFSTNQQPHDDTSLILQNIPVQDRINKRWRQIDRNVESMNNGFVVSGTSFTEEQASQAAGALRRGVAIRVPNGDVREAVSRFPAPPLPRDLYENLEDSRNELQNIFGTAGSTPQGTEQQKSVRGKILINQLDSSRIGGGVTEVLEQVADTIYNMWVQFMFVYYDEEHFISSAGTVAGTELVILKNDKFPLLKTLTITVKEGSLVPKDPLTQRNEAMDLWSAGAIDPLSFFKKLDFPDPVKATELLILWQMVQKGQVPPQAYLPSFQTPPIASPLGMPQGVGGPAVNPVSGPNIGQQAPPPQSGPAVQAQSANLLGAIPLQ